MSIVLRDYQDAAVHTTLDAVKSGLHPVIALPTGAGKSLCCAALCTALPGRVLVASHRQELLEQDAGALAAYAPEVSHGLYSAGLRRRDVHQRVIFGGVQSIYTKMEALQAAGPFAAIIIDECHLVAPQDADTVMYNAVFAACPAATRIGLSATPYRLDSGLLYEGDGCWFDTLASYTTIRSLTPTYLAPLRGVLTAHNVDVSGVQLRGGEFVQSELAQAAMARGLGGRPNSFASAHPGMHVTKEQWAHPCPKPLDWMLWLVTRGSLPGDTILDPFMGSGTTLCAAKDLGRRAIGIEREARYAAIAVQRLRQEVFPFVSQIG